MDVGWLVELTLEHARVYDSQIFRYFMDREMCFDRLPWEILYELEVAAGYGIQIWSFSRAIVASHQLLQKRHLGCSPEGNPAHDNMDQPASMGAPPEH